MIFDNLADLNLTQDQQDSATILFNKVNAQPFSDTAFQTTPQLFVEQLVRNFVCCATNGVNAAVVGAQGMDESGWGRSGVFFGIKASAADKAAGNAIFRPTHETVNEAGLESYKSSGDFIGIVGENPDGTYNISIKDWFFYAVNAPNMATFLAMHFDRYYAFMAARAQAHGFDLSVVSKDVDAFLSFLEDAQPAKGLYAYATGEGYKLIIKTIISDNGLMAFC